MPPLVFAYRPEGPGIRLGIVARERVDSRILYAIPAILMALFSHLADYNGNHLFNPLWPAHATFHDIEPVHHARPDDDLVFLAENR